MGDRFNSPARTVYFCLDEIEGVRPRIEFGAGSLDKIKEIGSEYEKSQAGVPFVLLYFCTDNNKRFGFAKIYIKDHDELIGCLDYASNIKQGLIDYMKEQNPGKDLRGGISIHGSDDNVMLDMLKRYVTAEEIVSYK